MILKLSRKPNKNRTEAFIIDHTQLLINQFIMIPITKINKKKKTHPNRSQNSALMNNLTTLIQNINVILTGLNQTNNVYIVIVDQSD